jgi:CrcB protein
MPSNTSSVIAHQLPRAARGWRSTLAMSERTRTRPAVLGAVAAGGALGASARYGVAQLVHVAPHTFPWATWWTNVTGSAALGVILVVLADRFPPAQYLRTFLATGFLGAYTTYSTFAVETNRLIRDGRAGLAIAYVGASLLGGLAAVGLGMLAGRLANRS